MTCRNCLFWSPRQIVMDCGMEMRRCARSASAHYRLWRRPMDDCGCFVERERSRPSSKWLIAVCGVWIALRDAWWRMWR